MNKKQKKVCRWIISLGCMSLFMPSCAPLLKAKIVDVDIPSHFENRSQETVNTSDVQWKTFFEDDKLTALIGVALENNRELKITQQQIERANNEILSRTGEYQPFVSLQVTGDLQKAQPFTTETKEDGKEESNAEENTRILIGKDFPAPLPLFTLGVAASWELDVWKKLRNAKNVAVLEYMATLEGRKFLMTRLVAEIADTYYELVALDNKLLNTKENIEIQKNVLKIIRILKQSARTNELAVKRFEAEVQKNQSEVYRLKQQIVETENKLNYLLGRRPQPISRSAAQFAILKPTIISSGIPSQLLSNRPDIKRAEHELEAKDLDIQVAKAKFLPSFGMNAGLGYQEFNPEYLINKPQTLTYSLSLDLSMPLVNKSAIIADYKNANAKQIQAAYEYEQTILNAYQEVSNLIAKIENLEKTTELKNQQVSALTESIVISNKLFKSARADYMEVLLTQREALEAKLELIETKKEQMSAVVNLYRALGGGWK